MRHLVVLSIFSYHSQSLRMKQSKNCCEYTQWKSFMYFFGGVSSTVPSASWDEKSGHFSFGLEPNPVLSGVTACL